MQLRIVASLVVASASAVFGANLIKGNWYGSAVDSILYTHWGAPGTYQEVTYMNGAVCDQKPVAYGGGMAPLDKEVSFHFRGPMHLKQFAFYTPGSSSSTRALRPSTHQKRHGHAQFHKDRALGDWVTATINGNVVSWINQYAGPRTAVSSTTSTASSMIAFTTASSTTSSKSVTSSPTPSMATFANNAGSGNWGRQAYYNAASGTADGLIFLNNHGGEGSGVFDTNRGMSLSYASQDGQTGAASPQILVDTLLKDNTEVIIYTDKPCQGNSCGYYRSGSVAYHGFDGASKLFLLEFDMPMTGKTGFNMDMPAVWILNAAIARTQQYGDCSCWPECGEWDIFEILDSGNTRAKSTLHADLSGGASDYFERPVNKTVKAAIVFDGSSSQGHIAILPDDTTFDGTIPDQMIANLGRGTGVSGNLRSKVFKLGSG